eukprot:gnl/TRDRNA2_/TRDRNA2_177064_c0_seq9.p1 gnl/TRDRNA2_/TRDRNA2_177064_c0~~gnl/TRDRNA2_/TRDRNA2_177064_c0_seq9.p1  ORF type:complete len:731 (-),score=213.45 gnl/TRDRNA2_/TRDRNA2_177064_c0_seq9:236-2335(-)
MKSFTAVAIVLAILVPDALTMRTQASPIGKIIQMLEDLEAKILSEGKVAEREYQEYLAWCREQGTHLEALVKKEKMQVEQLKATIEKKTSSVSLSMTQIEQSIASVTTSQKELDEAQQIRNHEAADFAAEERSLLETVDTVKRAIAILEREKAKHGASMLQADLKRAGSIAEALIIMVDASVLSIADGAALAALVQSSQASADADSDSDSDSDSDEELGEPDAAVYTFQGGGVIEAMEKLLEKARGHLSKLRMKEHDAIHAFELLNASITKEISIETKAIANTKTHKYESTPDKETAAGDLSVTDTSLSEDMKMFLEIRTECMQRAAHYDAAVKSRAEELEAVRTAKRIIDEKTGGAESATYSLNQVSFVQFASSSSGQGSEVVRFVQDLGLKQHSPLLAQLASRISSAIRLGGGEADVFAKVKGFIRDIIAKLEAEADKDAIKNAWCKKEIAENTAKEEDTSTNIERLKAKLGKMKSSYIQLKEEIAELQSDLAELSKLQAEIDQIRMKEKATFKATKADLEEGIEGIGMALKVLRDYYNYADSGASHGAGAGIISLLEVAESDFRKALADAKQEEAAAQKAYDDQTVENQKAKSLKGQQLKQKTKESTELDKSISEFESDLETAETELQAILDALAKIDDMCIAKVEPFEERQRRREAEIAGLQEALEILQNEAALVQTHEKRTRRALRGEVHIAAE